jgi:DNA gyrase subunit A
MGRTARGVRGLMLQKDQSVMSLIIACPDQTGKAMTVLTATKNGYGKRTPLEDYPKHRRGGQGVISIQVNERNGPVVSACVVGDEDQAMLITSGGTMIRTRVKEISIVGRNTQGVRLIGTEEGEHLAGLERVAESEDDE